MVAFRPHVDAAIGLRQINSGLHLRSLVPKEKRAKRISDRSPARYSHLPERTRKGRREGHRFPFGGVPCERGEQGGQRERGTARRSVFWVRPRASHAQRRSLFERLAAGWRRRNDRCRFCSQRGDFAEYPRAPRLRASVTTNRPARSSRNTRPVHARRPARRGALRRVRVVDGAKTFGTPNALAPEQFDLRQLHLVEHAVAVGKPRPAERDGVYASRCVGLPHGVGHPLHDRGDRRKQTLGDRVAQLALVGSLHLSGVRTTLRPRVFHRSILRFANVEGAGSVGDNRGRIASNASTEGYQRGARTRNARS